MVNIHHCHVKCEDCGYRHTPGNREECVELLKEELAASKEETELTKGHVQVLRDDITALKREIDRLRTGIRA